ncbi:hypothetical protein Q7P35_007710 [Cladosporium inversicolor]
MSKKTFKSQASSGRLPTSGLGGFGGSAFGSSQSSTLSYIQEAPDYSGISDANVVVAFKNLSKRDATTKAKALEDLLATVGASDATIEEGLLEAWVKLFPRLSIDSARRVRQLAHNLNGQVCSKSGKRVARHMPRIAGPWLAGVFDSDKAAANAARDSLALIFNTPEKIQGVRKTFHQSITEYCRDAALNETVQTLSDERTISADDAQATYARVVATSISLVTSMLNNLSPEEIAQQQSLYEELLENKIWDFVNYADTGVRRSMHRLVRSCIHNQPDLISNHLKAISTAYIYKGLPSDQTGSSLDFVQTLEHLTSIHPTIWTEAYSGKKPAASRLRSLLKHGSQAGPAEFWPTLENIVRKIPEDVLPSTYDEVAELLSNARIGVSKREDRFNASHSWQTYATIADASSRNLSEADQDKLTENYVVPVIKQYISPHPETSDWSITGAKPAPVVAKVAQVHRLPSVLERELPSLVDQLIEQIKISQPEQSKDFDKSQRDVAAAGERWAALQRELTNGGHDLPDSLQAAFVAQDKRLINDCFALLTSRDGKPYGAAATVNELLKSCGDLLRDDPEILATVSSFAKEDLPSLLFTPSQSHLAYSLYALSSEPSFDSTFESVITRLSEADAEASSKELLCKTLFNRQTPERAVKLAKNSEKLQKLIADLSTPSAGGKIACPRLLVDLLPVLVVSATTISSILSQLNDSLAIEDAPTDALASFDHLASSSKGALSKLLLGTSANTDQLLTSLLRLEKSSDDEIADLASKLSSKLSLAGESDGSVDKFSVVRQNLEEVSDRSLSIDSLLELTSRLVPNAKVDEADKALPSLSVWNAALRAVMTTPAPSLSVLSPFGGAVNLVSKAQLAERQYSRDAEGLSQALRTSMYVTKLLTTTDLEDRIRSSESNVLATLVVSLLLTVLVGEDNMSVSGMNALWIPSPEHDAEVLDFIGQANAAISKILNGSDPSTWSTFQKAIDEQRSGSESSSEAYYSALASSRICAELIERHGSSSEAVKGGEESLRALRKSGDLFATQAQLLGNAQALAGSQYLNRVCNELVSDLTGLDVGQQQDKAVRELVTLNTIFNSQDDVVGVIAKQRLVFLIKHITPWLEPEHDLFVRSEVAKALAYLLPGMQDIYGEHWTQILSSLTAIWTQVDEDTINERSIPLINATLRLLHTLRKLSKSDDPNDDLVDALKDQEKQMFDGLLNLLKSTGGIPDDSHQPLMVTNELLCRLLSQLPPKQIESLLEIEELYPLMMTRSRAIQQAAFSLLHIKVPSTQENISFDAALDNRTAQLPDELLSLILEAPTLDTLADASFDRSMPLSLQSYLYSWRLLFDYFANSSYKVKSDYINQLKDGTYLSGLLNLSLDFLGHTRGKPIDASKFNIQEYQADLEDNPERDVQYLLSHLFYLALTHLPSLVKAYYLDIRSRQTSLAVESWTAKYISPLIVASSLQGVAEWSEKSIEEDPENEKWSVKVGMRSKEINVSYVVDEQTMAIKIVLPDAYPLASAQVMGVSRVAVKEEKWQSWLRNCQGVITFSNGSISDGVSSFRRNVTGALKGQSECAICYSIISGDRQLPQKRCPTCKHMYHASCLFKWFKTSNASTCPLCRNAFNFN